MDYNKEKQTITIFTKAYKLDTLATRLSGLNGAQVRSFFENRGMMLPRKFSCMALTSVLNERIKTLTSDKLKKDYFTRLQYYNTFSELQLLNLWEVISWAEDFKQLRINFWKLILINFVGLNLSDGEIQYLITLKKLTMESFAEYYEALNDVVCEQANTFDGQDIDVMQENLTKSASAAEMQEYAEKYSLEVPQRLNKAQLAEYAYYQVKDDKRQPTDIKEKLDAMNVTQLNNFCKEWRIDMASGMNKQQVVTYMFFYLSQCEILKTSLKTIESLPMYEPLEFRVDLSVATPFGSKEAKKIIYYDGDEEETANEAEVSPAEEKPVEDAPVKKAVVAKAVVPTIAKNAKRTEVKPDEEEENVEEAPVEEPVNEEKVVVEEIPEDAKQFAEPLEEVKAEESTEEQSEEITTEPSNDPIVNAEPQKAFFYEADQPEGQRQDEEASDLTKDDFDAASSVLEETPEEETSETANFEEPLDEQFSVDEEASEVKETNEQVEEATEEVVDSELEEALNQIPEKEEETAADEENQEAEQPTEEATEDIVDPELEEALNQIPEKEEETESEEAGDEQNDSDAEMEEALNQIPEKEEEVFEQKLTLDEERLSIILRNFDVKKFADKKTEKLPKNALPIGDVTENDKYGSKAILDLKKSKKGLVIGLVVGAVALIAAGVALWYFVFNR